MIKYNYDFKQRSSQWYQARCGILTASEMNKVLTPKLKIAANAASKSHLFDLMAQRITGNVEEGGFQSEAMLRGDMEEIVARDTYAEHYAPVKECGFITNDEHGCTLGFSTDGLVGEDGFIEVKSRAEKYQMQTIINHMAVKDGDPLTIPEEFMLQCQTGLLVTGRKWCDFISICTGLNMVVIRVEPDEVYEEAIIKAAGEFEIKLLEAIETYKGMLSSAAIIPITERVVTEIY